MTLVVSVIACLPLRVAFQHKINRMHDVIIDGWYTNGTSKTIQQLQYT